MAYIDCVVDTQPMANEINTVSTHINGTTAAVVGMRAAVIQAEEAAAEHVCDNVNKGFYTLIHSQISQKIAKLQSEVDSHIMKLNQLRKQLLSIKSRMERDYNMISRRYVKLFNGLNKNLEQRVFELDRPTIEFSVKEVNTISNRTKLLTATVPVSQTESLSISQQIIASNMKYRGMKVIDSMSRFLTNIKEQKELTDRILLPIHIKTYEDFIMIPIIISESNYDKYDNKRTDIFLPQSGLIQKSQEEIKNTVNTEFENYQWEEKPINDEIKSEFSKYLSASSCSQRVNDLTNDLFMAHNFQTIKM